MVHDSGPLCDGAHDPTPTTLVYELCGARHRVSQDCTASDGSYPIARPLLMYTDVEPAPHVAAYLNWIKSDQGQCIIKEKGYAPATNVTCG